MAKGRDAQKAVKKKSEKSLKEKRKEKKAKKENRQLLIQIVQLGSFCNSKNPIVWQ